MPEKIDRQRAVKLAADTWSGAPLHIRAMAGPYVGPLLAAVQAIERDLEWIREQIELMKRVQFEHHEKLDCFSVQSNQMVCSKGTAGCGVNHGA